MTGDGADEGASRAGRLLGGKYRVGDEIGRGGMGVVYRGVDEDLGGVVAIKFLHRMYTWDVALRERFRREAQALARLRHPGIVSLLELGTHDEDIYMVMELVTGTLLSTLIDGAPLSFPFVAAIFDELLAVLEIAHGSGIVHRDVKPSNVIVLPGDRVKLLDFGLVRLPDGAEKLTRTGIAHGTPDYMSPEQSEGFDVGPASDVYSAAVLLYECLAGQGPFDGGSGAVLMAQHMFVQPPPMESRGHKREVPPALEALVRRALAKKAADRPSATELRGELTAIFKGTDSLTLARESAAVRHRDAALSRGERSLTGRPVPVAAPPTNLRAVEVRVVDAARAALLRSALGLGGLESRVVELDAAVSPATGAIVVSASEGLDAVGVGVEARVPVLVVDVGDARTTREAIRRGAADIVQVGGDGKVAPQVMRLLRRGR